MRRCLPLGLLVLGCGSSTGSSPDALAGYVGRTCVVRLRPDVLGAKRDNPVEVGYGMQNSVAVVATGALKAFDDRWVTIVRKDGSTVLVARDTVVTVDFGTP